MKRQSIPKIISVMTPFPQQVHPNLPLTEATALMKENAIRHLPITDKDEIVAMLSYHDIERATAFRHQQPEDDLVIGDVCRYNPILVDSHTRLDHALQLMAEAKVSSLIVTHHQALAGIFTATDACRQFAQLLQEVFRTENDNDDAA